MVDTELHFRKAEKQTVTLLWPEVRGGLVQVWAVWAPPVCKKKPQCSQWMYGNSLAQAAISQLNLIMGNPFSISGILPKPMADYIPWQAPQRW